MTPPRFSIVITSCNQRGFIGDAVDSALALRRASCEIIVVDDASTDGSQEFLQSYGATIQVVTLPTNHGRGGARNRGAALAAGDYLVFLDGDDVLLPWALDVYDAIASTSNPQLLCATMRWFSGSTTALDATVGPQSVTFVKYADYLHKDRPFGVSASAIVVGRTAFANIGGWSTLPVLEDQELLLRLSTAGPVVQRTFAGDGGTSATRRAGSVRSSSVSAGASRFDSLGEGRSISWWARPPRRAHGHAWRAGPFLGQACLARARLPGRVRAVRRHVAPANPRCRSTANGANGRPPPRRVDCFAGESLERQGRDKRRCAALRERRVAHHAAAVIDAVQRRTHRVRNNHLIECGREIQKRMLIAMYIEEATDNLTTLIDATQRENRRAGLAQRRAEYSDIFQIDEPVSTRPRRENFPRSVHRWQWLQARSPRRPGTRDSEIAPSCRENRVSPGQRSGRHLRIPRGR